MNNVDILANLYQYNNLIKKLSQYPVKKLSEKPIHFRTSTSEEEELYLDLQTKFIEYCHEFDESINPNFAGYIKGKLGWYAHHRGSVLLDERKNVLEYNDEYHYQQEEIETVEETEEDLEIIAKFEYLIPDLSKRQREVVELHFYERYRIFEIAKMLGISDEAVLRYRKHAVKRLKMMFEKEKKEDS